MIEFGYSVFGIIGALIGGAFILLVVGWLLVNVLMFTRGIFEQSKGFGIYCTVTALISVVGGLTHFIHG